MLIVDDEELLRATLRRVLSRGGLEASTASNGLEAIAMLEREPFDVVLTDVFMPEMTGPELLQHLKRYRHPAEVIIMTAFADIPTAVDAVRSGAFAFLTKPFVANEAVVIEVRNAAHHKRLREKSERLEHEVVHQRTGEMVGACSQMREVYRLISRVASTTSTALILGESGTGKELVARAIHDRSPRKDGAFVTVNCGAIPKELLESELFGHKRGAFTSALSSRTGLFEAADGGTIFLDEIGELPLEAQVKLLRTLQSSEVRPVGSDTAKLVDVRVVAATNADLRRAIQQGQFREDLFYRLNVIAIRMPPLRERNDDILLLAHHFIHKHGRRANKPDIRLGADAAACLLRYPWPGNVRELEHAIEYAIVLGEGETIDAASLPEDIQKAAPQNPSQRVFAATTPGAPSARMEDILAKLGATNLFYAEAKRRVLMEFNEAYVSTMLRAASGNITHAAKRAGLDRSNFRRLLRASHGSVASNDETDDDDDQDDADEHDEAGGP